jgi:hypothetical protein
MASGRIAEAARQGDMFVAAAARAEPPDQPLPLLCDDAKHEGSVCVSAQVRSFE